jgi:hypothetical protein
MAMLFDGCNWDYDGHVLIKGPDGGPCHVGQQHSFNSSGTLTLIDPATWIRWPTFAFF